MPPRGVKSPKRKRQYEHIKESAKKRGGRSAARAEEIAARTVNKQRRQAGQTRSQGGKKKAGGRTTSSGARKKAGAKRSGARKK